MEKSQTEEKAKKPSWIKAKPEDIKKKVIELSKNNNSPEKIGLVLRDQEGIPKVKVLGLKISKILKEANLASNSELENLARKKENAQKHFEKNKHDYSAQRSVMKLNGRINKLKKIAS